MTKPENLQKEETKKVLTLHEKKVLSKFIEDNRSLLDKLSKM